MIKLSNVSKTFNSGKPNEVKAVTNINLDVKEGEFVVVVGANGSGKSTLLNLIAGTILADTGTISIGNEDVTKTPDYSRSKWIARIFQNPLLGTAADLSILDNFRLAALRTQKKGLVIGKTEAFEKKVQEKVGILRMGLEYKLEQPIGTLSGGQRQALTLLMSVMDDCKILLLDEPTAALDPRSAGVVMSTANELIAQYKLTVILVTHNLKDAAQYGNRIIHMEEGSVLRDIHGPEKLRLRQNELFEWFA